MRKPFYQIKEILPKVIKKTGLEAEIKAAFVLKIAKDILEEKKLEAIPFRFKDGDLFLKVKSGAFSNEIVANSFEVIEAINRKLGKRLVKRIKTRVSLR